MPFEGSVGFITQMNIDWDDFRSFPSGHAMQCAGLIFVLPPLAEVFCRLKGKKTVLFAAGAVFAVLVGISRMVMGAHFLSDVCMGSLLAVVFAFIYLRFMKAQSIKG